MIRTVLLAGLLAPLCAVVPALAQTPAQTPARAPASAPVATAPAAPGVIAAPTVQPADPLSPAALVGVDGPEVERRLGRPSLTRAEGRGAMWTYRRAECSVFVFFEQGADQIYRVTGLDAGARRLNAPTPTPEACLAGPPAAP